MEGISENPVSKSPKPTESDHNYWSFFFLGLVFLGALAIDQASKYFALKRFLNYNFAFSLPVPIFLVYLIYFVVVAAMVIYVWKNHQRFSFWQSLAWVLIFAGAASNIGERIYLGLVRDWIFISLFKWTGIYNLADFYILAGIVILLMPKRIMK